jgi:hypothetical protein
MSGTATKGKGLETLSDKLTYNKQYSAEATKNIQAAKGDTVKTLNTISVNDKLAKEMEAKLDAKRQALGLSMPQLEALKDAAGTMSTMRALYNQMGGDVQLAKMEAEQKAEIAKLPADQRAAAEEQASAMTKGLKDMRDGAELRKKYGDKSGDVLLKHADELAKLWDDVAKLMGKK